MATDVLVCFVLCLLCVNVQISTQNVIHKGEVVIVAQDINPGAPDILSDDTVLARGKSLVRESKNEGLIPLFKMARGWMDDIVVPDRLYKLIARENVETWEDYDNNIGFGAWSNYFAGIYAFCAIGLLFIIVFPILSCIYCCCAGCLGAICCCFKICTCCCKPSEPSTCRIVFWSLLAFGLIGTMFATIICAYISTEMINKELKGGSKGGLYDDMTNGLTDAENFFIDAINDTDVLVNNRAVTGKDDVNNVYDDFPSQCLTAIDDETQAQTYLNQLVSFTNNMEPLSGYLSVMEATEYTTKRSELDTELTTFRGGDIDTLLDECVDGDGSEDIKNKCTDAKQELTKLIPEASYGSLKPNTEAAKDALNNALAGLIVNQVAALKKNYDDISIPINTAISPNKDLVDAEMDKLVANVTTATTIYNASILHNYTSVFPELIQKVNKSQTDGEIKNYWNWLVVFPSHLFTTALLVLVSAYLLGISLDLICSTKLALGSKLVTLCNLITLVLLFLVMIPCSGFFGYGTYLHAGDCRHLVAVDESFEAISKLYLKDNDINYNFTATDIMESCSQNKSLYSAFQFENTGFKINNYVNTAAVSEIADEVKNIPPITIDPVIIMTDTVKNTFIPTIDDSIKDVNFVGYDDENAKQITAYGVPQYIMDLEIIVAGISNDALKPKIQAEIDKLNIINDDLVTPMAAQKNEIETNTDLAKPIIQGIDLGDLIPKIETAQPEVNSKSSEIVNANIPQLPINVNTALTNLSTELNTLFDEDIAQCRSLYDAVNTAIYAPCVYLLYPFNAIWFVYGWYIAFGIAAFFVTKRYQAVMEQKRDSR